MAISPRGALAQWTLVSLNALLAGYCLAVAVIVTQKPCPPVLSIPGVSSNNAAKTCSSSVLELTALYFHLIFAALLLCGACIAFVGHSVLVRANRVVLLLFALCYTTLAVVELLTLDASTLLATLELAVAVCTLGIGMPSSFYLERDIQCERQVLPQSFDSVLPSPARPSDSSNGHGVDRQARAIAPEPVTRLAW